MVLIKICSSSLPIKKIRANESWGDYNINADRQDWEFLKLEDLLRQPERSSDARRKDIGKQLEAGSSLLFKVWKLIPSLKYLALFIGACAAFGIGFLIYNNWDEKISLNPVPVGTLVILVFLFLAGIIIPVLKWLQPQKAINNYIQKSFIAVAGWVIAWIHLLIFDPLFKRQWRLSRLLKLK